MNDGEYLRMIQQRDLNLKVQTEHMSEDELVKIINDIDIKTLLRNHQLSNAFLHSQVIPRLDSETNLSDIERLQRDYVKSPK
jgi:arsenate reductase-like glutaredoxin family protein